jgi:hypothetical protein
MPYRKFQGADYVFISRHCVEVPSEMSLSMYWNSHGCFPSVFAENVCDVCIFCVNKNYIIVEIINLVMT